MSSPRREDSEYGGTLSSPGRNETFSSQADFLNASLSSPLKKGKASSSEEECPEERPPALYDGELTDSFIVR